MKKEKSKLIIRTFHDASEENHSYLLLEGGEAALIDPGEKIEEFLDALEKEKATLKYLLLTHGYRAFASTLSFLRRERGGIFCMHREDLNLLPESPEKIEPDRLLGDKDRLKLGSTEIQVLHTPGHTMGALCFRVLSADALFSGYTLLRGEYGKIHGPNGMRLMMMSLRRLYNILPHETAIYPGRGPSTTVRGEAWMFCLNSM